jgi:hypothetical protein
MDLVRQRGRSQRCGREGDIFWLDISGRVTVASAVKGVAEWIKYNLQQLSILENIRMSN